MDIRKLQRAIVDGLEDVKAQNIVVFNTEHLSSLFERVIIASGTSNRQTKSLASGVREAVKKAGYPVPRTEGEANGEWIIVDCGAAVVHVMQPTIREYYHLEEIWGDKPVNIKLASAKTRLVKAAEPEAAKRDQRADPRVLAERAKADKVAARSPRRAPVKEAASAKKTAVAKATAARKASTPRGGVVTRVVGVKTAATGTKRVATKTAARKTAAAKSAAVKTTARKTSTSKAAAGPTAAARKTRGT